MEPQKIKTAFIVTIYEDDSISTAPLPIDENVQVRATNFDIFKSCKEIVDNMEQRMLAEKIAAVILARLEPKSEDDERKERIRQALEDRGVKVE